MNSAQDIKEPLPQYQLSPVKQECSIEREISSTNPMIPSTSKLSHDEIVAPMPKISSVQYICITDKMYNDLYKINNKEIAHESRLCCMASCLAFQRIENEKGLHAYIEHLIRNHSCIFDEQMSSVKEMLAHRLECHKQQPFVCLQIVEYEDKMLVYKIERHRICEECADSYVNDYGNETDFNKCTHHHAKSSVDSKELVTLNDTRHIINLKKELVSELVFMCDRHDLPLELGTKGEAVQHHNQEHSNEAFQTRLQRVERYHNVKREEQIDNPAAHRAYLFECFHCQTLFESFFKYQQHFCMPDGDFDSKFMAHRLVSCHIDEVVQTFTQMKYQHYAIEHPEEECTPVDIFNASCCGLCDYSYTSINDLIVHYRHEHAKGEILTSDFLVSLGLWEKFDIDDCYFAPRCCPQFKTKGFEETVKRMCRRHFTCDQCTTMNFNTRIINLINYQLVKKTPEEIIDWLLSFKHFSTLFTDMQIILPSTLR